MIVADTATGRIVLWNPGAEQLFGYPAPEALGIRLEALIPEPLQARHQAGLARYRETGHGPLIDSGRPIELPAVRKDGAGLTIELTLSPIEDASVPGRFVLAILRDVTERKRAEEEHIQLIREHTARAEAEAALRARDEFVAVAAHELKTPITSVRGYAQLLRRHLRRDPHTPPQWLDRALETIEQQAGKLAKLMDQLFIVSHIQAGRLEIERRPTELVGLVRKTVAAARRRTRRHTLVVRARPRMVEAFVDPLRLERVLSNLLDNALKYSPNGGEISVAVSLLEPGFVRLAVTDPGLGIPPEQRDRVFERFHRAHADQHRSGLGLGLHVSRQIVEQHGGRIGIEAPPEGGTRVVVSLPIGQMAPETAESG